MNTRLLLLLLLFLSPLSYAQSWERVSDTDQLSALFTDTTASTTLAGGSQATATYSADGTGELNAWGSTFARHWKVEEQQACLNISGLWQCFIIEKQVADSTNTYRATQVDTGKQIFLQFLVSK